MVEAVQTIFALAKIVCYSARSEMSWNATVLFKLHFLIFHVNVQVIFQCSIFPSSTIYLSLVKCEHWLADVAFFINNTDGTFQHSRYFWARFLSQTLPRPVRRVEGTVRLDTAQLPSPAWSKPRKLQSRYTDTGVFFLWDTLHDQLRFGKGQFLPDTSV